MVLSTEWAASISVFLLFPSQSGCQINEYCIKLQWLLFEIGVGLLRYVVDIYLCLTVFKFEE